MRHVLEPVTIMIGTNIKYIRAISSSKKPNFTNKNIKIILSILIFNKIIILNQLFSKKTRNQLNFALKIIFIPSEKYFDGIC